MDDLFLSVKELNSAYLRLIHLAICLLFHHCVGDNIGEHREKGLALIEL